MLTKFRVKNYKSFKEETVVVLNKEQYKILADTNSYDNILKGALFVGANASGKTNLIDGISTLLELLFAQEEINLNMRKCLFSESLEMILEYEFKINGSIINYFLCYDCEQKSFIEKLKVDGAIILERDGEKGKSRITEERDYTDLDKGTLLLREIYFNTKFRGNDILKGWFGFLSNSISVDCYKREIFVPQKTPLQLSRYLEEVGVEDINKFFEGFNLKQRIEYTNYSKGKLAAFNTGDKKHVFFKRENIGEPIPIEYESLGNTNLLHLLPPLFHSVEKGGMLIFDEFSSGLHNFLEELLIKYFMQNSTNAQLFFVSHSTNLLTNTLLRPDQIYSVDFRGVNGSRIKRFSL